MNRNDIWEVLECCIFATEGNDLDYLISKKFNPELAKMGIELSKYLKAKELQK